MILVDRRAGSKDLLNPLNALGVEAELVELPFGDVAFDGRGVDDTPVSVGIEFKQLEELVTSIRDGRFSGHQLPGMRDLYDYSWLLIEGAWRSSPNGDILTQHRHGWSPLRVGMSAAEYDKHLLTFQLCGGIHVVATPTRHDTLRFLVSAYRWWTDRALDQHTSHLAPQRAGGFLPVSEFRRTVMVFPGVGLKSSRAVEEAFKGSLRRACQASVEEWAGIATKDKQGRTKRLGNKVAAEIVAFIRGDS